MDREPRPEKEGWPLYLRAVSSGSDASEVKQGWTERVLYEDPPARLPISQISVPRVSEKARDILGSGLDRDYAARITIWTGGKYVEIRMVPRESESEDQKTGQQGEETADDSAGSDASETQQSPRKGRGRSKTALKTYTQGSRKTFKTRIYMIDRTKAPRSRWFWLTLTCSIPPKKPYDILADAHEALQRSFGPDVVSLWRLQVQERGVVHYHVLVYVPGRGPLTLSETDALENSFVRRWSERVLDETRAPVLQTNVQRFDDEVAMEKAIEYMISDKQDYGLDLWGNRVEIEGRRWGIIGRKAYQKITSPVIYLIDDVGLALRFRRQLRHARRAEMRSWRKPRRLRSPRRSVDGRLFVGSDVSRRLLASEVRRARRGAKRFGWPRPMRRI